MANETCGTKGQGARTQDPMTAAAKAARAAANARRREKARRERLAMQLYVTRDEEVLAAMAWIDAEEAAKALAARVREQRQLKALAAAAAEWTPHDGQTPPPGDWRVWMILAGRGFGKTRAGAEWVMAQARARPKLRVALCGATIDEVGKVMVRGASGLMAVARPDEDVSFYASRGVVDLPNQGQAFVYSGEKPDMLRGPEHHIAWVDELAKYAAPQDLWDNLMLGLRLGPAPRVLVTTTPRPIALVKRLKADAMVAVTGGATAENVHLPPSFVADVTARYGATRLGRQELGGEIVEDVAGALWTRDLVERCRAQILPGTGRWIGAAETEGTRPSTGAGREAGPLHHPAAPDGPPPRAGEDGFTRIVIGVDPPVSADGDACGIVVCALAADGCAYVIADHTAGGLSPEGWARRVAAAAEAHGADRVVAEANQGGAMVESVLRAADCALPVKLVHARRGKAARAEPVAALFESGRAWFASAFPELEDELCGLQAGGDYAGPGRSPDRADAMVWALTELMLGQRGAARVRGL